MMKSASKYETPSDFLGGCGGGTNGPRVKLRASWVQPKDEEHSLESLMLKPSKKPADFMGSSSNGLDHKDRPMDDSTEKTANSSVSELDLSYGENLSVSEPTKKWTPLKKEDDSEPAKSKSSAANSHVENDYLPGCEPKPIKRWTPPPKEDPVEEPKRMIRTWDQPDDFLGGCAPTTIKRWTPPPKEDSSEPKRMSATWDQPTQFLGGCEPKAIRRWSKPTN